MNGLKLAVSRKGASLPHLHDPRYNDGPPSNAEPAEKVFTVPRSDLPEDLIPEVGDELSLSNEDDEELDVVVLETSEEQVTFDANHPLAGEDVTFEIELVSIL